jgi:hypothetical protein
MDLHIWPLPVHILWICIFDISPVSFAQEVLFNASNHPHRNTQRPGETNTTFCSPAASSHVFGSSEFILGAETMGERL